MMLKQFADAPLDSVSPRMGWEFVAQRMKGSLKLDLLLVWGWTETRH